MLPTGQDQFQVSEEKFQCRQQRTVRPSADFSSCAEGYLFELERRGYLQAGPFVPEVVIDHPEAVTRLHEDFVHAGSDVVEAFT